MNPRVHICAPFIFCCFLLFDDYYISSLYVVAVSVVSLANTLVHVASLEAKDKAASQALKEADAVKASADKAAKAVEAKGY
jgi:hypothetical protein